MSYLEAIKDDMAIDKCVLILGPDLYFKEINNKLWERREYFEKLKNEIPGTNYFEKDEVFSTSKQLELDQSVKNFYTGTGDLHLLELISSIRFPLILNASPDEALFNFLHQVDQDVNFACMESTKDQKTEIHFDRKHPLIYYVFGRASDRQSLITSHSSLYEKIQLIVSHNSLPSSIIEFLKDASSFMFLGFQFDSWSYQLLSYTILSYNAIKETEKMVRIYPKYSSEKQMVTILMLSAMGMQFIETTPAQILDQLIFFLKRDKLDSLQRTINKQPKYVSYLSYSRMDNNNPKLDLIVDILLKRFESKSQKNDELKLIYDKKDLSLGQSIDSFMTRIGNGKTVILVISDKYLKSEYCMIEALRVDKCHNVDERIFTILIENNLVLDSNYKDIDTNYYINYWRNEHSKYINTNPNLDKEKIINYTEIQEFISDFLKNIYKYNLYKLNLDSINLEGDLNEPVKSDFEEKVVNVVINKMKED